MTKELRTRWGKDKRRPGSVVVTRADGTVERRRAKDFGRKKRPEKRKLRRYDRYLKSPAWKAARLRYKASGRPMACAWCGSRRFELHHLTYERIGNELPEDLIALCKEHHIAVHRKANVPEHVKPWLRV